MTSSATRFFSQNQGTTPEGERREQVGLKKEVFVRLSTMIV